VALDQLLAILGFVVIANVLLLALIPLRARAERRSRSQPGPQRGSRRPPETAIRRAAAGGPPGPRIDLPGPGQPRSDEDARAAAAIEAFIADVSPDAAGRTRAPAASEAIASVDAPGGETSTTAIMAPRDRPSAVLGYTPAGLADPVSWDRTLREESARVARFGRPVTVVIAEISDLAGVAERLGRGVADRVVTETARLLATEGRAADRLAWLGDARFGILLSETEENRATGYVDRVRQAADGWLESAGLSVRLSLGWASPTQGLDVMAAAAAAQERMHDGGQSVGFGRTADLRPAAKGKRRPSVSG
jgi:diguanylate cyclase (GGDEF)-like protein